MLWESHKIKWGLSKNHLQLQLYTLYAVLRSLYHACIHLMLSWGPCTTHVYTLCCLEVLVPRMYTPYAVLRSLYHACIHLMLSWGPCTTYVYTLCCLEVLVLRMYTPYAVLRSLYHACIHLMLSWGPCTTHVYTLCCLEVLVPRMYNRGTTCKCCLSAHCSSESTSDTTKQISIRNVIDKSILNFEFHLEKYPSNTYDFTITLNMNFKLMVSCIMNQCK